MILSDKNLFRQLTDVTPQRWCYGYCAFLECGRSWVRVTMGSIDRGFESRWGQQIVGSSHDGVNRSWVRVTVGSIDRGFESRWGQQIVGSSHGVVKPKTIRLIFAASPLSTYHICWLARNRVYVSGWSDMSTHRLLFH